MRGRLFTLAVAAVGLAGCSGPETEAMGAVASQMRDPESARFREVRTVPQADGSDAVCGEVNAKNAFGAYVGYVPFAVHRGRVIVAGDPDRADVTLAHTQVCVLRGRSLAEVEAESARIEAELAAMK